MLPLARQARLADRRENFFARGQLFLDPPIQPFVLEIQHGIVIADRGLDQALRVPDRRGIDDFEPGRVQERRLGILRVEWPAPHVPAAGTTHDDGRRQSGPVARRGDVIRQHVVGTGDEVDELHLRNGPEAHVRRAGRGADDRRLGDRRVDHARFAETLGESLGDLECAAIQSDVFAEDEDAIVALHLLPEPLAQRFEERDFGGGHYRLLNQSLPAAGGSTYTLGSAVSGSGSGSSTHASVA